MLKKLPIYSIEIDENDINNGVYMISLVHDPASKKKFIALQEHKQFNLSVDKEKRIVTGVVLRSNFPIYRREKNEEFLIKFSKDMVFKYMLKFMKEQKTMDVNLNHDSNLSVDGCYMIESFIFNDNHKLGFDGYYDDLEPGSWMATYKIDNEEVWNEIVSGKLTGFSPELTGNAIELSENTRISECYEIINLLNKLYENNTER